MARGAGRAGPPRRVRVAHGRNIPRDLIGPGSYIAARSGRPALASLWHVAFPSPSPTPKPMSARSRIHDSVAAETATSTREQRAGTRSTRPRHDWERLVLEIVVVVAGILIAFALDSWWDSRGEAARERAHLRALRGDFVQNVERLDQAAARQEGIVRASRQLLALSRTDGPVAVDSVRSLVGRVLNSGRFGPVMGAYEAVVNTGGLAQIRDDSLRSALAEFASNLGVRYTEEYSNSLYFPFIREYAGRLGFLWNDRPADGSDPTSLQSEDREFLELLRDPRFQGQVALRAYAERDVAGYYRGLQRSGRAPAHAGTDGPERVPGVRVARCWTGRPTSRFG